MNTLKSTEGKWLTQVAIEDESARSFVHEVSSFGSLENWRECEQAEKDAWEQAHPIEEPMDI